MSKSFIDFLRTETNYLDQAGLLRHEPKVGSAPGPTIKLDGREAINLASGDYLGLSTHPEVKAAAKAALESHGVGLSSPRMFAGTLAIHEELEKTVAKWTGTEDAVLFASGHHANVGLFEALIGARDFVFCDEMVRPSLADGIRLSRARVLSYRNRDIDHLEDQLKRSRSARFRIIATDGVFPVDGQCAPLREIYTLAAKYEALVVVDDSHGIGVLGESGRGTHVHLGLGKGPDVVTATFGNALGGGGGFVACSKEIATWLRQKARSYLAATALAPAAAAAGLKAVQLAKSDPKQQQVLLSNAKHFREAMVKQGYQVIDGPHPAVPVMVGNAVVCQRTADLLHKSGVYAIGFCHPVVPEGAARIRAQITAAHTLKSLDTAAEAFGAAKKMLDRTKR